MTRTEYFKLGDTVMFKGSSVVSPRLIGIIVGLSKDRYTILWSDNVISPICRGKSGEVHAITKC